MDSKFTAPDGAFKAGVDQVAADAMAGKNGAVALRPSVALGCVGGDIDSSRDFRLPRLSIAYGVGAYAGVYPQGSLVLGKPEDAELISEPPAAVTVVIMSVFQYWKEWLKPEQVAAGLFAKSWNTQADAQKAGFITEYSVDRTLPAAARALDVKLLIESPSTGPSAKFGVILDGKSYAPAYWCIDKMAYKACGETILQSAAIALKARGLHSGRWTLHTVVVKKGNKTYVNPILRLTGFNSDAFIADVMKQLSRLSSAQTDDAETVGTDDVG